MLSDRERRRPRLSAGPTAPGSAFTMRPSGKEDAAPRATRSLYPNSPPIASWQPEKDPDRLPLGPTHSRSILSTVKATRMLDKTTSTSNEMPIGVAIVLTLVGIGLFFLYTLMWIGPALWVHFAYRPATATVLETRPTERSIKGGRLHGLKARIGFPVEGRTYQRWVTLPRESRRNEGPEAEAVRNQLTVGQQIPCFHDPFRPGTGAVLERTKLEWGMLFAVLFALAFVAGGAAGIVTSWERTFPRGVAVETAEVVRRLPRSFYLTLLGALAIGAVGVAALVRAPSEYGFLALIGTIAGVFVLVREAARRGAVAWPSPERRAARGRAVGHPTAGEKPARPALSAWTATEPVAVGRGDRLAVRLRPAPYSEYPVGAAGVTFFFSMVAGVIGLVLLKRASIDLEGEPGSLSRSLVISAVFLAAFAMAVLAWRRTARRVRAWPSRSPGTRSGPAAGTRSSCGTTTRRNSFARD